MEIVQEERANASRTEAGQHSETVPVLEASALFGRHRQVVIGHNGSRYVLRITKHGKLILNK